MGEQTAEQELREKIFQMILEIRQYLCDTEFAPEPFIDPVNVEVLRVKFPNEIIVLIKEALPELAKEVGYRIPMGKAPLLTDEEIWEVQQGNSDWDDAEKGRAVSQAQNDADNKHYGGQE